MNLWIKVPRFTLHGLLFDKGSYYILINNEILQKEKTSVKIKRGLDLQWKVYY